MFEETTRELERTQQQEPLVRKISEFFIGTSPHISTDEAKLPKIVEKSFIEKVGQTFCEELST